MEPLITIIVVLVFLLGLVSYVGQTISVINRNLAEKLGVADPSIGSNPVFLTYEKGIAVADMLFTWPLPLACLLYFMDHPYWVYFGIIGGAIFTYHFALITFPHILLERKKVPLGGKRNLRVAYILAVLWGLSGLFMIFLSISAIKFGVI